MLGLDGWIYSTLGNELTAGVAHMSPHLALNLLAGIVEVMALGLTGNRGVDCIT